MLDLLNVLFYVAHTALVGFNSLGWMAQKTRRATLVCQALTLLAWTLPAPWLGFGYCWCTDAHWQIRRQMGIENDPNSFIALLFRDVLRMEVDPQTTFLITAAVAFVSAVGAVSLSIRDARRRKLASSRP